MNGFQAGLLVDSRPYYVSSLGTLLVKSEQSHSKTHACSEGQRQYFLNELVVKLVKCTDCQVFGELQHKTTSCCFGLICHDVTAPANPMSHMEMSLLNHSTKYA